MIWSQEQPTYSECGPSAVTAALEAPAWKNSLRPRLKVRSRNTKEKVALVLFKNGISLMCFFSLCFPELSQNNTAVILGAAVGGAAMLFIVVVVLFLRRRSVTTPLLRCSVCLSDCHFNQLDRTLSKGFLSDSFAFPLWGLQLAFAFTLSSPLSFCLPSANFLFFFIWICVPALTREEFALNAPCHCSIVIF